MNIYLIGMPGSGKSSVGRQLARLLARPFVDLDDVVEEIAGKPIPRIFDEDGEAGFRREESAALSRVGGAPDSVVACGGGTPLTPANRTLLTETGTSVFLSAPIEVLHERVRPGDERPLIARDGDLDRLLAERDELYRAVADHVVLATGPPSEVAAEIAEALARAVP